VALEKVFEGVTILHNMHHPFVIARVMMEKVCNGAL